MIGVFCNGSYIASFHNVEQANAFLDERAKRFPRSEYSLEQGYHEGGLFVAATNAPVQQSPRFEQQEHAY